MLTFPEVVLRLPAEIRVHPRRMGLTFGIGELGRQIDQGCRNAIGKSAMRNPCSGAHAFYERTAQYGFEWLPIARDTEGFSLSV